jgi:hypothetical protein
LGVDTLLGANWGSQTDTHRIREEREGATRQHLIGLLQHVSAMCQHLIGPPQPCGPHHYTDLICGPHQHATWQAMTGPPHHPHATWQHSNNTPQHITLHPLPHGYILLVQLGNMGPTGDTWHSLTDATSAWINAMADD